MARVLELKKRLRTEILAKRRSLSRSELASRSEAAVDAFYKKFAEILNLRSVHCSTSANRGEGVASAPAGLWPDRAIGPLRIGVYRSLGDELSLEPLIKKLHESECILFFPRVISFDPPGLRFYACDPFRKELWTQGPFKLLEPLPYFESLPSELDFILVPLVAVDENGNRLGYGKGHYDSVLKNRGNALAIGMGFDFQKVDSIPVEKHDVKLDASILV